MTQKKNGMMSLVTAAYHSTLAKAGKSSMSALPIPVQVSKVTSGRDTVLQHGVFSSRSLCRLSSLVVLDIGYGRTGPINLVRLGWVNNVCLFLPLRILNSTN